MIIKDIPEALKTIDRLNSTLTALSRLFREYQLITKRIDLSPEQRQAALTELGILEEKFHAQGQELLTILNS